MADIRVKMTEEEMENFKAPIEQVLTVGHGEVTTIVKITDHRIVFFDQKAQYELRSNGGKK